MRLGSLIAAGCCTTCDMVYALVHVTELCSKMLPTSVAGNLQLRVDFKLVTSR